MLLNTPPMTCVHLLEAITATLQLSACMQGSIHGLLLDLSFVVPVNIRALETLDRVADAIPVMDEMSFVQVRENVVVEVVARSQTALQQNGLTTTQLGGGNMVELPTALFSLPSIPATLRISAVSINNRNLVPPRTRNNLLRGNIISVNLNVPEGLSNLGNDQRIRLTFTRVCIMWH